MLLTGKVEWDYNFYMLNLISLNANESYVLPAVNGFLNAVICVSNEVQIKAYPSGDTLANLHYSEAFRSQSSIEITASSNGAVIVFAMFPV